MKESTAFAPHRHKPALVICRATTSTIMSCLMIILKTFHEHKYKKSAPRAPDHYLKYYYCTVFLKTWLRSGVRHTTQMIKGKKQLKQTERE